MDTNRLVAVVVPLAVTTWCSGLMMLEESCVIEPTAAVRAEEIDAAGNNVVVLLVIKGGRVA
jgi:hypothetical protein